MLCLGDSITQGGWGGAGAEGAGWLSLLAGRLGRRADVLNRGYSGYTTRWALELLPHVFAELEASCANRRVLVTVFFGANDSAMLEENPRQHVCD